MRELPRAPLKLLLVVNEHGSVEGIVTEGDILKAVVANIEETDAPHIVQRDDGSLLIDGAFPIDELAERLRLSLPPNRAYHTLAGFALAEMRRLPRVGEAFHHGQWQFEIVDLDGRRIDKLLATPLTGLHRGV
jgi:putative hemolysin